MNNLQITERVLSVSLLSEIIIIIIIIINFISSLHIFTTPLSFG